MQGLSDIADMICLQETLVEPKVSGSEAAALQLRFYQGVPAQVRWDALGRHVGDKDLRSLHGNMSAGLDSGRNVDSLVGLPGPEPIVAELLWIRSPSWSTMSIWTRRGFPQGNALSVTLAVFWGSLWEAQCRSIVCQNTDLAVFLDDLSASSTCQEDLVSAVGIAVSFASHWQVTLSEIAIREWPIQEWALPRQGA